MLQFQMSVFFSLFFFVGDACFRLQILVCLSVGVVVFPFSSSRLKEREVTGTRTRRN
jgi:hypothetical protein